MHKICFIVNPLSGSQQRTQSVIRLIEDMVKPVVREYTVAWIKGPGDGSRLSGAAIAQGFDIIAAVGGDGTVNEVGQALVGSSAALAVIPTGSGNGFARNLSVPLSPAEALRLLLSPQIMQMDAGKINNRYFFSVAGIGFDAAISKAFEQHGSRGTLSYFLAGIKTFFNYEPTPVTIHHEAGKSTLSPLLLSIANGSQYGSGAIIAPQAKPDDGLLDVCTVEKLSAWQAIWYIYRLFNGSLEKMEGYRSFQTRSLRIVRPAPGLIHLDGDPHHAAAVLQVEVVTKKLQVVAGNS